MPFMKKRKKQRGQSIVEYGLLLIISIFTAQILGDITDNVRDYLTTVAKREQAFNYDNITTPNAPDPEDIWNQENDTSSSTHPRRPVAFFSVTNPIYTNDRVPYWDGSYDPDGIIVSRTWEGKKDSFNRAGQYVVSLTVVDNDDLTDTYQATIQVVDRGEYTKLVNDHENEIRTEVNRSPVYNVGSDEKRIIEHIHGERTDRYNVNHLVIEKNLWKHTQDRAQDVTYEVNIPILEVTYDGDGNIIREKPYTINGVPQFTTQIDVETIPISGDIGTGNEGGSSSEPEDNHWVFYIYDEISSVRNQIMGGPGEHSPSTDYPRFAPEERETMQDPESFITSRDSKKSGQNPPGYDAKSSQCRTCTVANDYERKSEIETKKPYDSCSRSGSSEGQSFSLSASPTSPTYSRTRNWIEHEAYDYMYKYEGTAFDRGTETKIKLVRNDWKTDGWVSEEMRGVGSSASPRPKYTDCEGDGWSSECWQPLSTSGSTDSSWKRYGGDKGIEESCNSCYDGSKRCDSCSWSYSDYVMATLSCSWYGKENTSGSLSYSTERRGTTSCSPSPADCPTPPPPKPPKPPKP